VCVVVLLVAGRKPSPPRPARGGVPPPPVDPRAKEREALRSEALALLGAWTEAQNKGDFAGYVAMYQRDHFKGIKRTRTGGVKSYDFAGWSADRKRMF